MLYAWRYISPKHYFSSEKAYFSNYISVFYDQTAVFNNMDFNGTYFQDYD